MADTKSGGESWRCAFNDMSGFAGAQAAIIQKARGMREEIERDGTWSAEFKRKAKSEMDEAERNALAELDRNADDRIAALREKADKLDKPRKRTDSAETAYQLARANALRMIDLALSTGEGPEELLSRFDTVLRVGDEGGVDAFAEALPLVFDREHARTNRPEWLLAAEQARTRAAEVAEGRLTPQQREAKAMRRYADVQAARVHAARWARAQGVGDDIGMATLDVDEATFEPSPVDALPPLKRMVM